MNKWTLLFATVMVLYLMSTVYSFMKIGIVIIGVLL